MAVITFAHRGARLVEPENTIPAFRVALDQGASGIETDVWLSRDGEVVCVHDPVVPRGPGVSGGLRRRRISSATAQELAAHGIPRLADVYRELGSAYELSVDVKTETAAEALVEVARAHDALDRLWVCSPDVARLRSLRDEKRVKLVHSDRRAAIGPALERHAFDLASAGIDAMNLHHSEWSAGLVSLFHRFEVKAFAWDAQEVRHLRAALAMGIDAVYCDRADRMVATVSEWVAE